MNLLAWVPFVGPLPSLGSWWPTLLIPLALGISVIYKALRVPSLDTYVREVIIMTLQIILAMVALTVVLMLIVQVVIPTIPAD